MKYRKGTPAATVKSDIGILRYLVRVLYDDANDKFVDDLVERFGSVNGIFRATYEELMSIDGMTERVASFFTAVLPLNKQALLRTMSDEVLDNEKAVLRFASVYFSNASMPSDVCVYLNAKNKIVECEATTGEDRVREIISGVCRLGAKKIVWLRYDPLGCKVSAFTRIERLETVIRLLRPLAALDVELTDYIEYSPYKFFGLKRAVSGGQTVLNVGDACPNAYTADAEFSTRLDDFYSNCIAHANDTE